MARLETGKARQGQAQCRAGLGRNQQEQAITSRLSKGMRGSARIHAGQSQDKPRTVLYQDEARVVHAITACYVGQVSVAPVKKSMIIYWLNIKIFQLLYTMHCVQNLERFTEASATPLATAQSSMFRWCCWVNSELNQCRLSDKNGQLSRLTY